jgi:hypothetical protein
MRALVAHAAGIEIWLPALLVAIVVFVGVRYGGRQDEDEPQGPPEP